jgi:hypothetical protein
MKITNQRNTYRHRDIPLLSKVANKSFPCSFLQTNVPFYLEPMSLEGLHLSLDEPINLRRNLLFSLMN